MPWSERGAAAVLLIAIGASGCHDDDPSEPPADCDEHLGADAEGRWTITGEGERSDCEDPFLNGKTQLVIESFAVTGTPVATTDNDPGAPVHEADAFVRRILRAQYVLDAGAELPPAVEFTGRVDTCEVRFTISERLPNGSVHQYSFDGFLESPFRISGEFTGRGPDSCTVSGDFDVDID